MKLVFTCIIIAVLCGYYCNVNAAAEDEVCQFIIDSASSSTEPECQPLGNCTGVSCKSNSLNNTVVMAVDKCTDPLEVSVKVYDGFGALNLSIIVTETGDIQGSDYRVDMFSRDEFNLRISIVNTVDTTTVIPLVVVPLNASDCMCAAIQQIGQNGESPVPTECQNNSACTGQECTFTIGALVFILESDLFPCAKPPGFVFIIRDSDKVALQEFYFDQNKTESLFGLYDFEVTVVHKDYSIIVHGVLYYSNQGHDLIQETQIILDQTDCVQLTSIMSATPSATPTPSLPLQQISPQTCQALKDIRDDTNDIGLSVCSVNVNSICDTVSCVTFNQYTSSFQILPCLDPPSIHAMIFDNDNQLYDGTISNTTSISLSNSATLLVGLTQQENAISVKVDADLGFQTVPLIPESSIPIDTCYCPMVYCSTSTVATTSTATTTMVATPSSTAITTQTSSINVAGGQAVNLGVAVAVPTGIILLIVILSFATIIGVVLFVRLKNNTSRNEDESTVSIKEMMYSDENFDEESIGKL